MGYLSSGRVGEWASGALASERTRGRWPGWMEYAQLGRTGLGAARLVLGTRDFGPQADETDSHAVMDAALDAGLNFFGTANVYEWVNGRNMGVDGATAWPNHDKLSALDIRVFEWRWAILVGRVCQVPDDLFLRLWGNTQLR